VPGGTERFRRVKSQGWLFSKKGGLEAQNRMLRAGRRVLPLLKNFILIKINKFWYYYSPIIAGLETFLRARRNREVPQGKKPGMAF